jgi:prepilin-type N-terminal cleavage/methylation domain-containing protein
MRYTPSSSGFTLVEMVLATTIFAFMSLAVISVYIQTTELSYRLKATRYLTETAREITEKIATDVRERGIGEGYFSSHAHPFWNGTSVLSQSGSELLSIATGERIYLFGKKDMNPPFAIHPCLEADKLDPSIHC